MSVVCRHTDRDEAYCAKVIQSNLTSLVDTRLFAFECTVHSLNIHFVHINKSRAREEFYGT